MGARVAAQADGTACSEVEMYQAACELEIHQYGQGLEHREPSGIPGEKSGRRAGL